MFEAVVALCLAAEPTICRTHLVPGYREASRSGCEAALNSSPPLMSFPQRLIAAPPHCQQTGPEAAVTEAAPGLFVHMGAVADVSATNAGDVSNSGFIIGTQGVAVIDSGGSRQVGEELYRALRSQTDLPVLCVILTHMHPDHVLGASVFAEAGARVVGHEALPRALADRAQSYLANLELLAGAQALIDTQPVLPDEVITATRSLDLGGRVIRLQAWPNAHTGADLTVGDPTSGILFAGDLLFHRHAPALDGSVLGWQRVLTQMQSLPYTQVVPGHGGPLLPWPGAAAPLQDYLEVLISETRAAITRGERLGEAIETIALGESDAWELFDLFNARNATVAYTELEWE
jgi:quinoprotein relay system zinc metallohydrolase 2